MEFLIDLDVFETEPAEEYHDRAREFLSNHQLIDYMNCPWLYFKKRNGLIEDKDSAAYLLGRSAHTRILEGRAVYESTYAIGGPINEKTGRPFGSTTKAFAAWAEVQGRPALSHEQADLIEQMASGVAMNPEAVDLLLYGRAEGVLRAQYCGQHCQVRIDWTHPHCGIVDLKTCEDLSWFESDVKRYRYINQMAFYQAVLAEVTGTFVPAHLVAIEKREPFRCGVWQLSEPTLEAARLENEAAMERLAESRAHDYWPTGYEQPRIL